VETHAGTRTFWRPTGNNVPGGMAGPLMVRLQDGPQRPRWFDQRQDLPCKQPDVDPDWWWAPEQFDGDKLDTLPRHAEKAIQLCRTCPMQAECELWGLQHAREGIWGARNLRGMHQRTRLSLLTRLRRERQRRAS
jgi:hypothetical protein